MEIPAQNLPSPALDKIKSDDEKLTKVVLTFALCKMK